MKVSVIVPVYNNAAVLRERMCRLLEQDYEDYEVILIDDGSNDGSFDICNELENEYSNVKVFHKENAGVSSARNYGIKKALGEYIVFCDADDDMDNTAIADLVTCAERTQSDLVVAGFRFVLMDVKNNKIRISEQLKRNDGIINIREDSIDEFWLNNNVASVWGKLFLKDVILNNKITFNENLISLEDYCFMLDYMDACNNIAVLSKIVYNYYIGDDHYLTRSRADYIDDILYVDRRQKVFFKSHNVLNEKVLWDAFSGYYSPALASVMSIRVKGLKGRIEKYLRIKSVLKTDEYKELHKKNKSKYTKLKYCFLIKGNVFGVLLCNRLEIYLKRYLHID